MFKNEFIYFYYITKKKYKSVEFSDKCYTIAILEKQNKPIIATDEKWRHQQK